MRVAFDASTAAFRQKTGTGVYCEELIRAYQEKFKTDQVIHTYRLSRRIKGREFLLPVPANARQDTLLDPWTYFKGSRYDIFHGLNSRLPLLANSQMVATVHDLFSIFGEFSEPSFRESQSAKLRQMINRAHHIIAPSSFTRGQLVDRLGVAADKVTVVSEGVRNLFLQKDSREKSQKFVATQLKIKNPYFLFVGSLEKRKNVAGLVRGYARFAALTTATPDLVLVGPPGFGYADIQSEIERSGVMHKIKLMGFVGESSLADLYRACEAFVYLSLEEGFGIPVIEAMACGVPVITSNTTSLPEVGGGYSWLVGPEEAEEIAATLLRVAGKTSEVVRKVREGQVYAQKKTWTKVAEETRQVYEKVLSLKITQ